MRGASVPQISLGVIGLDRMRQKNADTKQCNKRSS
jgi:hypothetical protein